MLVEQITEVNKRHQRKDLESIRATAQQTLDDAELTLKEGGNLGKTIIDRIMVFRKKEKSYYHLQRVSEMARHVLSKDTYSTCVSSVRILKEKNYICFQSTKVTVSKDSFRR